MPQQSIAVIFTYERCVNDAYPVVTLKLDKSIPELMAGFLEDAGFFVDTDDTKAILTVTAWQPTEKVLMVSRIVIALAVWNEQHCGYAKLNRTLKIYSNLEGVGNPTYSPPSYGTPGRRIGELKAELQQAVEFQEFEEADRIMGEIRRVEQDARNARR